MIRQERPWSKGDIIDVTNLRIGYQNRRGEAVHILRGVDLTIGPGETLGLVGESGSGKSTLALALLGYLRRGSRLLDGAVNFDGNSLFDLPSAQLTALRGARIALVPQDAGKSLTPTMRVGRQIEEAMALHTDLGQAARREWLNDLLHQVRLPDPEKLAQRYPHELSGGQQQRVAIAMAMAGRPSVLVLDEPTTGLDVTTQAHILTLLRELAQTWHMAMVYVSHDMGVIAQVSDRVAVMYAGEVVEDGPVSDVLLRPNHPYTRGLLASMPRVHLDSLPRALPGAPPALDAPRVGCAFAPRCVWADARCRDEDPVLLQIDGADHRHAVRCHHWRRLDGWETPRQLKSAAAPLAALPPRPLLRLEEVSLSYNNKGLGRKFRRQPRPPATVQDVSLVLQKGKTLALVGESGSGKSTLIRAIAGLLTPQRGTIYFDEAPLAANVDRRAADLQRRIQLIFQNPDSSLNPRHTVLELLAQPLRLYWRMGDDAIRARAAELLALVRLGEHYLGRYPAQLSGGEKQRVAVARVFAAEPDLILCDEITSSLDVSVQAAVLSLLTELQSEREITYLFVSHDLAVVRAFADDVAVLYQGRLCEAGPASAVFAPPFHPYTATLINATLEPEPGYLPQLAEEVNRSTERSACGCPFHVRCPLNLGDICRTETPPWQNVPGDDGKTHQIRCHIPWQELAGQSEIRFQMSSQTEHVP